jgi:pilus assembly protein CpaC
MGVLLLLPSHATVVHAARPIPQPEDRVFTMSIPRGVRRADDLQTVEIERGKTILLYPDFRVSRLAVGDPEIADFVAISDREIEILAKDVGDTNLLVWGDGQLQAVIDIHVGTLQPQIARELKRILNNDSIHVDVAGGSVVLRGSVSTLEEQQQATLIADAFLTAAQDVVGEQAFMAHKPKVINLLQVGGNHQVMIEIVIAEISRSINRAMGVNLMGKAVNGSTEAATFQTLLKNLTANPGLTGAPGTPAGITNISDSVTMAGTFFSSQSMDLRIFLEAVEANQLGVILAEPNVVARSGESASFLVGGEIPIPLVTGFGSAVSEYTVLFKKFGVNVEFTPTVLEENRIHLRVTPEVSEPDFSVGARVLGQTIPAFKTRRVETSVELGDGESFVLAGLLREDMIGDVEDFPFLADIPILGQLFRSRAFQKTQTELVLIVTPHLVQPLAAGTKIELPTDHYIEPTLLEFYWDGRIEGRSPTLPSDEKEGTEANGGEEEKFTQPVFSAPSGLDLELDEAEGRDQSGGFMGSFGYRLQSPTPQGGIE